MNELERDTVFIRKLAIETIIGIHPWERTKLQTVLVSLDIKTATATAAKTDDITRTLDYDTLAQRVCEFVSQTKFQLLETLAERIAELVLENTNVTSTSVEVQKPGAIANAETVGVRIERTRGN